MSKKLPDMLENTIARIRELVDANTVIGEAVTTPDGVTILPVSRISIGLGGGGSDFTTSKSGNGELPFGGGVGAGVKVSPVAFIVIKDGNVRILPLAAPASTTADRIVEKVPETLDRITDFIDSRKEKKP